MSGTLCLGLCMSETLCLGLCVSGTICLGLYVWDSFCLDSVCLGLCMPETLLYYPNRHFHLLRGKGEFVSFSQELPWRNYHLLLSLNLIFIDKFWRIFG